MNVYNQQQLKYSGYSPSTDPVLIGMGETENATTTEESEGDGGNFDAEAWGNGLGSVLEGVGSLLGGLGVGNNTTNLPNTSGNNTPTNREAEEHKKSSSMIWLIILGLIMTLIIVFVLMRKTKSTT